MKWRFKHFYVEMILSEIITTAIIHVVKLFEYDVLVIVCGAHWDSNV